MRSAFRVATPRKIARVEITREIETRVGQWGSATGAVLVSLPHTTAAVTLGESWDPDVGSDVERALAKMVPEMAFAHGEGNSPAHLFSEIIGASRLIPIAGGRLALGRWQGVFLIELDGPREREVSLTFLEGA